MDVSEQDEGEGNAGSALCRRKKRAEEGRTGESR